ncbi:hypothetical protein ACNRBV_04040 [Ralstonia pseudosolanacearum]|uniref:hypothetical protein n=1 Tax=Ralstonia pseudosolanacearum TaxID=1310165 RepID=UPI0018A48D61|nr:hypothetical protein [Ralstonia pseudosolanacearum]BCL93373.1 hypothetical protein MAFF211479_30740 [Ralstonia solanacearum]BCN05940.1 hypothetical protein RPSB_30770 [Ralstonia solanacearum]
MADITEILPDNVPSFPDELVRFFEQAAAAEMHKPSPRSQHLLRLEDAVRWTLSVRGHPILDALGGLVLDDVETSNHHVYVGVGPLKGAVYFLSHDGESRIVYASLQEFLLAAVNARDQEQLLEEQHPASSPIAADQAGLSAWMRQLLTAEDRDVLVPPLVPSLDLSDSLLLRDLASDKNFFIAESVALEILARPAEQLTEIAELCARHRHPQVSEAGSKALAAIQALQV